MLGIAEALSGLRGKDGLEDSVNNLMEILESLYNTFWPGAALLGTTI